MLRIFSFVGLFATLLFGPTQPLPTDAPLDQAALTRTPGHGPDAAARFHSLALELASVR
jgi:hypothetical protein